MPGFLATLIVSLCPTLAAQAPAVSAQGDPSIRDDTLYALAGNPADYAGDAYIYLFDDGIVRIEADGRSSTTYRQVVQVLNQEGVELWGEYAYGYDPDRQNLRVNWARVLAADGTMIRDGPEHEEDTPDRVSTTSPVYSGRRIKRLTLGGVAPGTIVDVSYTRETVRPWLPGSFQFSWRFNLASEVKRSRYLIDIPEGFGLKIREKNLDFASSTRTRQGRTVRTWLARDLPKVEFEQFAGFPNDVLMNVTLSGPITWSDVAQFYHGLSHDRYLVTPAIEEAAARHLQDARTPSDTLRALYRWVAQDFRYVALALGDGSYQPRPPAAVFETKFGDCKDKTTLFLALLRNLGVDAYPLLVSTSGGVDSLAPGLAQFDHMIAAVPGGEGFDVLDLTSDVTPYGEVPSYLQGEVGLLLLSDRDARILPVPASPAEANRLETRIMGSISRDGSFTGSVTVTGTGTEQYGLRETLSDVDEWSPEDRVIYERDVAQDVWVDATVDSSEITHGRDLAVDPRVTVWMTHANVLNVVGGKYLLQLPLEEYASTSWSAELETRGARRFPIDVAQVNSPSVYTSLFEVTLPPGWLVELPEDVYVAGVFGTYRGEYTQEGRTFRVVREMAGLRGLQPPDSLNALIDWFRRVADDRVEYVVITPSGDVTPLAAQDSVAVLAAILPSAEDISSAATLATEGPASDDDLFMFAGTAPVVSLSRAFEAQSMVFTLGGSRLMILNVAGAIYHSAEEAGKGIKFMELFDIGTLMEVGAREEVGDQISVAVSDTLDFSSVAEESVGWLVDFEAPFMNIDMAMSMVRRGRVAVVILAGGPDGEVAHADVASLVSLIDERIRARPALLTDLDVQLATDDVEPSDAATAIVEGIPLYALIPTTDDIPGSVLTSESFYHSAGIPGFDRELEGRGFTFALGSTDVISLQSSVQLHETVPQAIKVIADAKVSGEADLTDLLNDEDLAELLFLVEDPKLERVEHFHVGDASELFRVDLRGAVRVDMYVGVFAVGRLSV